MRALMKTGVIVAARGADTLAASARPVLVAAKEQPVATNIIDLTAVANDQLSSSLAATGHGLFSYFLKRGLEGDAADGDREITAATMGRVQTPQVAGDTGSAISSW